MTRKKQNKSIDGASNRRGIVIPPEVLKTDLLSAAGILYAQTDASYYRRKDQLSQEELKKAEREGRARDTIARLLVEEANKRLL